MSRSFDNKGKSDSKKDLSIIFHVITLDIAFPSKTKKDSAKIMFLKSRKHRSMFHENESPEFEHFWSESLTYQHYISRDLGKGFGLGGDVRFKPRNPCLPFLGSILEENGTILRVLLQTFCYFFLF